MSILTGRRPTAAGVVPHGGAGLGLPTTTTMATRQPARRPILAYQVVPIDWRTPGPSRTYGADAEPAQLPPGMGSTSPCEECN